MKNGEKEKMACDAHIGIVCLQSAACRLRCVKPKEHGESREYSRRTLCNV